MDMENDVLNEIRELINQNFCQYYGVSTATVRDNAVCFTITNDLFSVLLLIDTSHCIDMVFSSPENNTVVGIHSGITLNNRTTIYKDKKAVTIFLPLHSSELKIVLKEIIDYFISAYNQVRNNYYLENIKKSNDNICFLLKEKLRQDTMEDMRLFMKGRQLSMLDTLKALAGKNLSLSRFGDGEITCLITDHGFDFQEHSWKLMNELRDICRHNRNTLVCFPGIKPEDPFWNSFWSASWKKCKVFLDDQFVIGNSMVSRIDIFNFHGQEAVTLWKDLWDGKSVCFVSGKNSRFDPEHILFSNIKSGSLILSENRNAYSDIDRVFESCMAIPDTDIFLIALGVTGTILSSRLAGAGKKALDIGHLTNCYDQVFLGKPVPEKLNPGWL